MHRILLLLLIPVGLSAQNFTQKTNVFEVDFTDNRKGAIVMPNVEWITPRLESTFSGENWLELEATANSTSRITSVTLVLHSNFEEKGRRKS